MASPSRAWRSLQRNIPCKNQIRFASGSVLDKFKRLVGMSREEADVVVSGTSETNDEFLYKNVEERMKNVASKSFPSVSEESWKDIPTTDIPSKYKLVIHCYEEFGSLPPNNLIHDYCSVNDFVKFYETKKQLGIVPEIWRLQNQKLPKNLSFEAPIPMKRA